MKQRKILFAFVGLAAVLILGYLAFVATSPKSDSLEKSPVAVLVVRNPPALDAAWVGFKGRMTELGYVEGTNIQYVDTEVATDLASTKQRIMSTLRDQSFDFIYVMGVIGTRAAKEVTEELSLDTPVLFAVVSDPVGGGLVKSIQHSGNNLTGITPASNLAVTKRLELTREMLPKTKRIVYAWNDERTSGIIGIRQLTAKLGLELSEQKVANVAELKSFFQTYSYREGDTLFRTSDSTGAGAVKEAVSSAIANKVPLIGTNEGDTTAGALMSYGANYVDVGKAAARMAVLILQGVKPNDISVEEASQFVLSVNLKTAKAIGVVVPEVFLLKAHKVISAE